MIFSQTPIRESLKKVLKSERQTDRQANRHTDRYMIIYGWQQLEGLKENGLKLKASSRGTNRTIISIKPPFRVEDRRLGTAIKGIIYNSPSSKIQRLFNSLPRRLRNMTGVSTDTFKGHLDRWLQTVPDQPKSPGYSNRVAAETNGVIHQVMFSTGR